MTQKIQSVLITDKITSEGSFEPSLYFKGSDIAQRLKNIVYGSTTHNERIDKLHKLIAELEQPKVKNDAKEM